jgi:hypothetical protein
MGRPPLPIGTWGTIRRDQLGPNRWRARTNFRDYDGETRVVEAHDTTGAKAENKLRAMSLFQDDLAAQGGRGGPDDRWVRGSR